MARQQKPAPHPDAREHAPEEACNGCRERRIPCTCGKSDNTGAGPRESASGNPAIVRDSLPTDLLHRLDIVIDAVRGNRANPPVRQTRLKASEHHDVAHCHCISRVTASSAPVRRNGSSLWR